MRPVTTRSLVAAKFRSAALSVVLSWLVVLIERSLGFALDGRPGDVAALRNSLSAQFPGWRAPVVLALGFLVGPALAFRQLTDFLPLALANRPWISNLAAFVLTSSLGAFLATGLWLQEHPGELPRFLVALPWLVATLLASKFIVSAWSFRAALQRGLLARRDMILYGTGRK